VCVKWKRNSHKFWREETSWKTSFNRMILKEILIIVHGKVQTELI